MTHPTHYLIRMVAFLAAVGALATLLIHALMPIFESNPALNGLILEQLENIPDTGTSLRVGDYTIEIVQSAGQVVRNARIFPPAPIPPNDQVVDADRPGS